LTLVVAVAAFGRDLVDFTFPSNAKPSSTGAIDQTSPSPTVNQATEPVTTPTPPGYDPFMPTGAAFASGVVTITTDGVDLDLAPPESAAASGGDAEFHTSKTEAFATDPTIKGVYQWAEYGAPTQDQCNAGVLASGDKSTSVSFADAKEGTWAFCIITSEGRDAYIVLDDGETLAAETVSAEASIFVW
jgi:hypothetical protein